MSESTLSSDQELTEEFIDIGEKQIKRQALDALFARAMSGLIPRGRALKANEPDTLDERHLQALLMRASGAKQKDIAHYFGWTDAWTSIVLNHPDAQYVLTRLVSYAADNVIDMNERLKAYAPEALDVVIEVIRSSNDEKLRSSNAFEIIRMAGYGAKKDGPSTVVINNGVTSTAISNLSKAILESREIEEVEYELLPAPVEDAQAAPPSGGNVEAVSVGTNAPLDAEQKVA